ncbi:hypothetical protein E0Z10_g6814 [Xylaria hypoxylon]|uniref:Uncharacterized protein n=1 Tax=Xylaria hypoxylon TaxID=37992 RepID=A0A4Z0YPI5_9PEZI|nr:hypothetical protein E0Z10_g6814 [Xylaria hypoxylon]
MPPKAIAACGDPPPPTLSKNQRQKKQKRRHRRSVLKKKAKKAEKLLALIPKAECAVPCVESDRCSRCWDCPSGHTCMALEAHVVPVATRLVAAIEAKVSDTSGKTKHHRGNIRRLRCAVRILKEIPESEFAAAFAAVDPTSAPTPSSADPAAAAPRGSGAPFGSHAA